MPSESEDDDINSKNQPSKMDELLNFNFHVPKLVEYPEIKKEHQEF